MIDIETLRFEYDSALDEYWYAQDLKNIAKADWKYATCALPPNYPVPARIVTFDYWPASETMDGQPALYCFDQYRPDSQLEWLKIGNDNF